MFKIIETVGRGPPKQKLFWGGVGDQIKNRTFLGDKNSVILKY